MTDYDESQAFQAVAHAADMRRLMEHRRDAARRAYLSGHEDQDRAARALSDAEWSLHEAVEAEDRQRAVYRAFLSDRRSPPSRVGS